MSHPTLEGHASGYTLCAYCTKVCRFACPVADASRNEGHSTWAKMTAAHLDRAGQRPLDAGSALAVHACTGCMRCTEFCKHSNDVAGGLVAARGKAIHDGLQPKGAAGTLATFAQAQNPFGVDLVPLVDHFKAQGPVRYALFTGCTALVKRQQLVDDAVRVADAFGAPVGVSRASARCCGYPLWAAGAMDQFRTHALATARALREYHELVVLDPGCAFTLKVLYPRLGVDPGVRVRTLVEVLAENLQHAPHHDPLNETVGYHDACKLGRGLGQYDEPRALVLKAAAGLREAPSCRSEGGCSGGGGLLPRTMPETSTEVARRQAAEVAPAGEAVVSACPTSTRMFERAGRKAEDLVSLLRRWLDSQGGSHP